MRVRRGKHRDGIDRRLEWSRAGRIAQTKWARTWHAAPRRTEGMVTSTRSLKIQRAFACGVTHTEPDKGDSSLFSEDDS
jgi:hypothetical protein